MTELMKKYIEVVIEERKNTELYQKLLQERHQKISFIEDNEKLFGRDLRSELIEKTLEFYDNDKQFQEVQTRLEKSSHEIDILWQLATDEEKFKLEQYSSNLTLAHYNLILAN